MHKHFSIPNFTPKEIQQYLSDISISIHPSLLAKPTPSDIQQLYEQILESLTGLQILSSISQAENDILSAERQDANQDRKGTQPRPSRGSLGNTTFHNTHDRSMTASVLHKPAQAETTFYGSTQGNSANPFYNPDCYYIALLATQLSSFLASIGFTSFTIRDLAAPDPKRTLNILSAIINFSMYRDSKRDLLTNTIRTYEENEEMKEGIEKRIEEAHLKLEQTKKEKEEMKKLRIKLEDEISVLEDKIKIEYKDYRVSVSEIEGLKEERNRVSDLISTNQMDVLNAKQEVNSLEGQVVSDPEKLVKVLGEMRDIVAKEKESVVAFEARKEKMKRKVKDYERVAEDLKKVIRSAVGCDSLKKRLSDVRDSINEMKASINNHEYEVDSLSNKMTLLVKQIHQIEGKLKGLKNSQTESSEEINIKLKGLGIEYENMSRCRKSTALKIEENVLKTNEIEEECNRSCGEHQSRVNLILEDVYALRNEINNYLNELAKILKTYEIGK